MNKNPDRFKYTGVGLFGRTKKPGPDKKYSSFNRRMLAATLDSLVAMIVLAPLLDYVLSIYYPLPPIDWTAIRAQMTPETTDAEANRIIVEHLAQAGYIARWANNLLLQFISLSVATGICWHFWAATPGKMLLRMKIVDAKTEEPISDSQILLRLMGYIVSTMSFCIGFFWIGLDKRRQSWHDKLADTVVINIPFKKKEAATPGSEAAAPSGSREPSKAE